MNWLGNFDSSVIESSNLFRQALWAAFGDGDEVFYSHIFKAYEDYDYDDDDEQDIAINENDD